MKKPTRADFGYNKNKLKGWADGDIKGYMAAVFAWENRPKTTTGGRQRSRPIHPSWSEVLKHFDSNDLTRSQGAFCRWAKVNRASFSSWQTKPLRDDVERWILEWEYISSLATREVKGE